MSKRRYRKQRTNGLAWPVLAFGAILLMVAAFLFASRAGGGNEGGAPQIAVDPQNIDYGYLKLGTNESFRIKVTNNGDGPLRFQEKPYIEVLEGC